MPVLIPHLAAQPTMNANLNSAPPSPAAHTERLLAIARAAFIAADGVDRADAVDLLSLAFGLEDWAHIELARQPDSRPFMVVGSDEQAFLYWTSTPEAAAIADLCTEEGDVAYDGWEPTERAAQRERDLADLFRNGDWESWTVRVYDVLGTDLSQRDVPVYGDGQSGSRVPLVATFTAHAYVGFEPEY